MDKITLGGQEFFFGKLNIGQLEELTPIIRNAFMVSEKSGFSDAVQVISTALVKRDPKMTLDGVRAIDGVTVQEIQAAVIDIAKASGLVPKDFAPRKATTEGKAEAVPMTAAPLAQAAE